MNLDKCSCSGYNLDKLVQPSILSLLAKEDLYGYKIVQCMVDSPMFKEGKPDSTGVYRFLKTMEKRGLVTSRWDTKGDGPAKRIYKITNSGKVCLARWIVTLEEYRTQIGCLLQEARSNLANSV